MVFMGPSFFFIFWRSFAPGDRHPCEVVVTIANSSFKSRRAKRVSSRNSYGRYESFALQRRHRFTRNPHWPTPEVHVVVGMDVVIRPTKQERTLMRTERECAVLSEMTSGKLNLDEPAIMELSPGPLTIKFRPS